MADIDIVIKIPEEIYGLIIHDKSELKGLAKAVKNGTPIPDNATNEIETVIRRYTDEQTN